MQSDSTPDPGTTPDTRSLTSAAQEWLVQSDSWLAATARVVLVIVLALLSPVLIPVLWAAVLVVKAYNGLLGWYEVRWSR